LSLSWDADENVPKGDWDKLYLVILMSLKIEGKECTPSLFSQSVVGQFSPK